MRTPGRILRLVTLVMVVLGLASTSLAEEPHFKVIVHPDNPLESVTREFLREVYLRKKTEWHGRTVRPIDLSSKHSERERFTRDVIRKSPAQLRTYWNQQVFSGKAVPPPEVDSPAAIVTYVLANPGAVGYLPAGADPGKAKVISIR